MSTTLVDDIESTRDGATLIIKFARPAKKNALTIAMYERLNALMDEAAKDASVKAVIFGSTSETFTAGNDLGDFMGNPPSGEDSPVFRFINWLAKFEKPLLAAVDGKGVGLGLTLLLHCDFVYATERTSLVAPFVNLGLVPEAASSLLLPKLVGHARAAEILLLCEPLTGTKAKEYGLVNEVLAPDQILPRALDVARRLAEKPPKALALSKSLLKDTTAISARMKKEGELFVAQLASPEVAEAITAFFEKRKPNFG